jgi:GTP 3',8-cyclase
MTMLPDAAGIALRVSVTDRCPLRCVYCRPQMPVESCRTPDVLQASDIVRLVRVAQAALGVAKVRLTGGEPLARDNIVDLVAALAPLGIADLALTTNGQGLAALARPLHEAGLARVNVSLDSLDPRTFSRLARGGELARTLAGVEAAARAGLVPVKINTVVLRGINDHEAEAMLSYVLVRGYELRFIELMPSGLAPEDYAKLFLRSSELRARLAASFDLQPEKHEPGSSSRRFRVTGAGGKQGFVGFISPNSHPFCSDCRRLRLTSDGQLLGCLGRRDHIGLMGLLRATGAGADERIAAALYVALGCKRGTGPFAVAMPMSSVGG